MSSPSTARGSEGNREHAVESEVVKQAATIQALEAEIGRLSVANAALVASTAADTAKAGRAIELTLTTSLFEAALRTVPIAMAIIDPDLRYIRVNAACATMTGLPIDAHPGRTLRDVNPVLSPELEGAMRKVLATGEPCLNYRLTRPTPHAAGGALEIVMHITAFRDADGAIAGICSTASDMTAWKSLQDQFFHAQKLEAVGRLAAGIAHDFNNMVTVIASYCDLVLLDLPPALPVREEIEEIRRAAGRATALARRMLGTVRNSAVIATPIDVRATIVEFTQLLRHAAGSGTRLDLSCADDLGVVVADPMQIEQVVMNLVINAVDAMPGGGTVTVHARNTTLARPRVTRVGEIPSGDYVELSVSDTGSGMDAATLSHIFEPFFTTKAPGKGTGLGLATVLGIVRELGGGVEVASQQASGTAFSIFIPRVTAMDARARTPVGTAATLPRGTETILLVHDEDIVRTSIARVLTRQGYSLIEARQGGEALRMLGDERSVALVIAHTSMPGLSGGDLTERIHSTNRGIPVLFVGRDGDTVEAAASETPARAVPDRVIKSPFEVADLLAAVRDLLESARKRKL